MTFVISYLLVRPAILVCVEPLSDVLQEYTIYTSGPRCDDVVEHHKLGSNLRDTTLDEGSHTT